MIAPIVGRWMWRPAIGDSKSRLIPLPVDLLILRQFKNFQLRSVPKQVKSFPRNPAVRSPMIVAVEPLKGAQEVRCQRLALDQCLPRTSANAGRRLHSCRRVC
jgi:hypothetical protein